MEGKEGNGNYIGKKVAVFFDDLGRVSRKDGICTYSDTTEIILDNKMVLPKARIVRIEVKE